MTARIRELIDRLLAPGPAGQLSASEFHELCDYMIEVDAGLQKERPPCTHDNVINDLHDYAFPYSFVSWCKSCGAYKTIRTQGPDFGSPALFGSGWVLPAAEKRTPRTHNPLTTPPAHQQTEQ